MNGACVAASKAQAAIGSERAGAALAGNRTRGGDCDLRRAAVTRNFARRSTTCPTVLQFRRLFAVALAVLMSVLAYSGHAGNAASLFVAALVGAVVAAGVITRFLRRRARPA